MKNSPVHLTQLTRDPFARRTLMRQTFPRHLTSPCSWCGRPGRFDYFWEDDNGRKLGPFPFRPTSFCSVGCFRAYYS